MDCRDAGRFVRCGFGYVTFVMLPRTRHVAAHSPCCRATLFSRVFSAYSAAHFVPVLFTCCHAPWCRKRGQMVSSSLHGAAHSMVPHTCMLPRTSVAAHSSFGRELVCCRASMVPRVYLHRAPSYVAAQSYVLPRTHLVPRMANAAAHSTCCHAWTESLLCLAVFPRISHGAAQYYVRPRTPLCHARPDTLVVFCVFPRSSMCCRASMVPRAEERFIVYVLPRIVVESVVRQPWWRLVVVG